MIQLNYIINGKQPVIYIDVKFEIFSVWTFPMQYKNSLMVRTSLKSDELLGISAR